VLGRRMASLRRTEYELIYLLRVGAIAALLFLGLFLTLRFLGSESAKKDRVLLRIFPQNEHHREILRKMKLVTDPAFEGDYIEVEGHFRDVLELTRRGIPAAIVVEVEHTATVPDGYPAYEVMMDTIRAMVAGNPDIAKLFTIGRSQYHKKPIYAVKISDHVDREEAEPSVLFMAGHHAREPVGMWACVEIIRDLLANRGEPNYRRWISNLEIWVIPCLNPDGYDYVLESARKFPWWRKNLRDNNGDGLFEPELDGVDLNRNYDFNWKTGGSDRPFTWFYRGKKPASEAEVRAVAKLAERQRFSLAVDFHSFGEMVMYPWVGELEPPDAPLLQKLAEEVALRLTRTNDGNHYRVVPLNGKVGQSACWLYARFRTLAFIIEAGPEYFPEWPLARTIARQQLSAVHYLLNRMLRARLDGQVVEARTGRPLPAMIQLERDFSPVVAPTRCDSLYGRFFRLVAPGKYRITAMLDGYESISVGPVLVTDKEPTFVRIKLKRLAAN